AVIWTPTLPSPWSRPTREIRIYQRSLTPPGSAFLRNRIITAVIDSGGAIPGGTVIWHRHVYCILAPSCFKTSKESRQIIHGCTECDGQIGRIVPGPSSTAQGPNPAKVASDGRISLQPAAFAPPREDC